MDVMRHRVTVSLWSLFGQKLGDTALDTFDTREAAVQVAKEIKQSMRAGEGWFCWITYRVDSKPIGDAYSSGANTHCPHDTLIEYGDAFEQCALCGALVGGDDD